MNIILKLLCYIKKKKTVMTKEEKIAFAKMFYDKLNLKNYNLKIKRDNDIN